MTALPYDRGVDLRQRRLVQRVYELGAPAMLHLLREVAAGADLTTTMQRYAGLPADFIRQLGGDRFAVPVHLVTGDAS